jgi:hypothetical protein
MLTQSSMKSASRRHFSVAIALAMVSIIPGLAQTQKQRPQTGHISVVAPTTQKPPKKEGHGPETYPGKTPNESNYGQNPKGSSDGNTSKESNNGQDSRGSTDGGTATNTQPDSPGQFPPRTRPLPLGFEPYIPKPSDFHNDSLDNLARSGPQVSDKLDMTGFVVKGFVHPNWPIVLDFMLDSPGDVQMDITAADNSQFKATIHNTPNRRAYAIFRLPANFGIQLQTAVYYVHSVPAAGATTPAPGLRTYGLGAGEKAVGSVAIDQLTFQPASIHPQAKEVANFGFHAHSAFDGVRAEFIIASLYNGRILVEKDQEEKLSPVPEGVRASGTWEGKGKPGEHMLQIRAWRGLENGGDWVVAWSPDIVDVIK